jgi:hypothetical protein
MLDRDSVLLAPAYCREPQPHKDDTLRDTHPPPGCDIYSGAGSLARHSFDKPAIPASGFDASSTGCERAFVVLKGPGTSAGLARLSMTATEISWFDWHVLRLSQLAPGYCEDPARIFKDLSYPAKKDIGAAARGR